MTARRGAALPGGDVHRLPLRVYYEDTDAAGIVYYANYLRFAERARTELVRALGFEQERLRRDTGIVFAVRRCSADYRAPARLDDALVVETRIIRLGGASVGLDQRVRRGDEELVLLEVDIVCLTASGRPARLPRELAAAFSSFSRHFSQPSSTGMTDSHAR
ncbi:MAG: 4-hydroxybenzoyl-CoA thioesterase [Rhodospirillales bacterium]|nr:4-hydroxybenzoyl-CoA thioesterase [Rhodospirillales bacterium]